MANYGRELRMGVDIRRKKKMEKATEFAERMKKVQEKAKVVLKRAQEETTSRQEKKKSINMESGG